jgi:hypothetical protein
MNVYFVFEGKTEAIVYKKWLSVLLPSYQEVESYDAVVEQHYYYESDMGVPDCYNVVANAFQEINEVPSYDYLVFHHFIIIAFYTLLTIQIAFAQKDDTLEYHQIKQFYEKIDEKSIHQTAFQTFSDNFQKEDYLLNDTLYYVQIGNFLNPIQKNALIAYYSSGFEKEKFDFRINIHLFDIKGDTLEEIFTEKYIYIVKDSPKSGFGLGLDKKFRYNAQIRVKDFDKDGFNDIMICKETSYMGNLLFYYFFKYDPKNKNLKLIRGFENLPNPEFLKDYPRYFVTTRPSAQCLYYRLYELTDDYIDNLVPLAEVKYNGCGFTDVNQVVELQEKVIFEFDEGSINQQNIWDKYIKKDE